MTVLAISLPFDFEQPGWLWLCLLIPLLVVASYGSLSSLEPMRRVLAVTIRSVVVLLLVFCLARIQYIRRSEDLTVLFLMDRSHSVESTESYQEKFVRVSAEDTPPGDRTGMIDFARNSYLQQLPMHGGFHIEPGRLPVMASTDRTNIASALRLAMAMFPHDTAKRIVLMSDGNDNMGDLLGEAERAGADGIPIDIVPLRYRHRNEVFFDRMIAPSHAEPGEMVGIRMVVTSNEAVDGTLEIYHNGRLVALTAEQSRVRVQPGDNTFFIKIPVDTPGAHTFEATFRPDDQTLDATPLNNTASAFTFVSGKGRALLISSNPDHDAVFADALRSENVKIDMISVDKLGRFGLLEMLGYSTIILSNVSAAAFTDQQQEQLASYVRDMGSGLIMLGGDDAFGAGGWIGSPVEEVMPVTFEIKHKRVIPRGALVVIMHSCEMPRGNYWGKEMTKKSVDTISSQDYFGVITYTGIGESWEVPLSLNTNKAAVKAKIDRMGIGDMPSFATPMQMAYKTLVSGRGRDAAQKHVIILSDGDAQSPSPKLLGDYKKAKITVSTIAIGWGAHVHAPVLARVAKTTGGKFYQARNPRQLPQIFVKESKVVRRPLIVDEPFQPQILHAQSELLGGISTRAALPQLGGMVLTSPKQSPHVMIPIIRATEDGNDPVLAHWQYELGKSVVFTSGYWPRWGQAWTQWSKYAKFWAQIVRWTMRQDAPANFDTYTRVEGSRAIIAIDALDKDASYLNLLQLRSNVIGPDNKPVAIEFTQTGPGHYEAEVDIEQAGQYLANVQAFSANGQSLGVIRTGLSVPFSPEYRDLMPNEPLLRQVQETTGGRWLEGGSPKDADVFNHDLPPTIARRPAWSWVLAWLLLPMFLLDVAVRRLASWLAFSIAVELVMLVVLLVGFDLVHGPWWSVFGCFLLAEVVGWAIRFRYIGPLFDVMTHTVTALGHTGERSTAALKQLKTTRDKVRDEMVSKPTSENEADASAPIPLAHAKRRYDAGDAEADQPSGDLADALGGAKTGALTPEPTRRPGSTDSTEETEGTTTSRLLRSRRRPQRDANNDDPKNDE